MAAPSLEAPRSRAGGLLRVYRSDMPKRLTLLLVALVTLVACTPEEIAWFAGRQEAARTAGHPCPDVAPLLELNNLPDHFHDVIWRESMCDPWAVNSSSGALGLTQIMPFWLEDLCPLEIACTEADLLDPVANLAAAGYVWRAQGAEAWSQTW